MAAIPKKGCIFQNKRHEKICTREGHHTKFAVVNQLCDRLFWKLFTLCHVCLTAGLITTVIDSFKCSKFTLLLYVDFLGLVYPVCWWLNNNILSLFWHSQNLELPSQILFCENLIWKLLPYITKEVLNDHFKMTFKWPCKHNTLTVKMKYQVFTYFIPLLMFSAMFVMSKILQIFLFK